MEEKKYLNLDGLTEYDALIKNFVNSKVFIGTQAEYETANNNGTIPVDALVILTDDVTTSGGGTNGGTVDLSNYYTKAETEELISEETGQYTLASDFNGFTEYAENNYATVEQVGELNSFLGVTNNTITNLEVRIENLEANGGSSNSYEYNRITETINLTADSAEENCQTLYVKYEGDFADGNELLGVFADDYEVYLCEGGIVQISNIYSYECEYIGNGIYSFALPGAMSGSYIVPDTDTSNSGYFVERTEASTSQVQSGKEIGYVGIERENVEIDINKVYALDASGMDLQNAAFVVTDAGEPLKIDRMYTLKLKQLYIDDSIFGTSQTHNDLPSMFKAKFEAGVSDRGTGEGRTFAYSDENDDVFGVNEGQLQTGYYINGLVEISFYTDDGVSLYVLFSPFATNEQ